MSDGIRRFMDRLWEDPLSSQFPDGVARPVEPFGTKTRADRSPGAVGTCREPVQTFTAPADVIRISLARLYELPELSA
jgi:hypothetical protein